MKTPEPLSDEHLAKIWDDALGELDQRDQLRFISRAIEAAVNAKWVAMLSEQEHIGWLVRDASGNCELLTDLQIGTALVKYERLRKLYAAPAQQEPTKTQIEAVARAICLSCEENPDHQGDARGNKFRWQDYKDTAKAAIDVLHGNNAPAQQEPIENKVKNKREPTIDLARYAGLGGYATPTPPKDAL